MSSSAVQVFKGTPSAPANPPARRRLFSWLRRHRTWLAIWGVFLTAALLTTVLSANRESDSTPLSAGNPGPEGAMAAAEILGRHGVSVHRPPSYAEAQSALDSALNSRTGSTLLLYDSRGYLGAGQLQALRSAADRIVVITPRLQTLSALGNEIRHAGVAPASTPTLVAECDAADASAAGTVSAASAFLYSGPVSCFKPAGSADGLYAASGDGRLVVLGSTGILSNSLLDEHGNAALVLRTLGAHSSLVWYLPTIGDVPLDSGEGGADPGDLVPPWAAHLGAWLVFVAVLSMFWRGRRLGPLVFEPLPVIVKAGETAEGRARLYQDAHAVERAADNLRSGTLVRLAKFLRISPGSDASAIVRAADRHLGRAEEQSVARVLSTRPRTERELVSWAQQLDELEKEVLGR